MMKSWEFLLQREGDGTWLPLETPTVEILEGRYRVVARTPRKDEEVDIYVSYVSTEEDPPKRRVQQRSRRTNPEGLVAFLSFTTLRTGRWELRCRPHVEPGSLEYQWPAVIQLQVLEQEAASADDLFGWDMPDAPAVVPQRRTSESPPQVFAPSSDFPQEAVEHEPEPVQMGLSPEEDPGDIKQLAERMSQMVVDSVLSAAEGQPLETDPAASAVEGGEVEASDAEASELTPDGASPARLPDLVAVTLTLREETLTLPESRTVALAGEIEAIAPNMPLPPMVVTVELRDPNTTEVWISQQQEIPLTPTPTSSYTFEQQLTVPTRCFSQLLLGTATVWQRQSDSELQVLTAANFTTMAPVDVLLSHVAATEDPDQQAEDGTIEALQQKAASNFVVSKLGMEPTAARANRRINADLLELLKPGSGGSAYKPTSSRVLPPQLNAEGDAGLAKRQEPAKPAIDLPSFGPRNPVFESKPLIEEPLQPALEPSATPTEAEGDTVMSPTELVVDLVDSSVDSSVTAPGSADSGSAVTNPFAFPVERNSDGAIAASSENTANATEGRVNPVNPDPYAIPEGASLEELAELFGPAPELGQVPRSSQAAPAAQDSQQAASAPLTDDSPEPPTMPAALSQGTPEQIVLPEALAGATFKLASSNDAGNDADSGAQTGETPAAPELFDPGLFDAAEQAGGTDHVAASAAEEPSEEDAQSEDPFMNRLHELTVPQPQVEQPSPVLLAEVVVEDEDLPPTRLAWMQKETTANTGTEAIAVDAPELQVPEKDLVVGETIRVSLRLPAEPAQLCARLWLLDCQTRTLLTEPQWVTAFLPFSEEQVEASIELKIPEGSVELQVEAIAVDPDSKRESRKVAVRRTVTLPDNVEASPEENRFNPWMT